MSDHSSSIATDGDDQTPSSRSSKSQKIAKKGMYFQKYNSGWEKEHPWLAKSNKDKTHFYCKCCRGDYHGGVTEIKRHELTTKHTRNASSIKRQQTILDSFNDKNHLETKIKEAELHIAGFIVQHNLSFNIANHLLNLIKNICPLNKVAQGIHC
jgi:hypothetical protein